jgi:hypothetical protein
MHSTGGKGRGEAQTVREMPVSFPAILATIVADTLKTKEALATLHEATSLQIVTRQNVTIVAERSS